MHGHVHVAVPREKDDRQRRAAGDERRLQLKPRHLGHAHVENEAARLRGIVVLKKGLRAVVDQHEPSHRLKKHLLRHAEGFIVVDDSHDRYDFGHCCPSPLFCPVFSFSSFPRRSRPRPSRPPPRRARRRARSPRRRPRASPRTRSSPRGCRQCRARSRGRVRARRA